VGRPQSGEFKVSPACKRELLCNEFSEVADLTMATTKEAITCAIMSRNYNRLKSVCDGDNRCVPPPRPVEPEDLIPLSPVDPRLPGWRSPQMFLKTMHARPVA